MSHPRARSASRWLAGLSTALLVLAGCSSATTAAGPSGVTATSAAPEPSASPLPRDEICRATENGGTYYLYVISETMHQFDACLGNKPFAGTLETLVNTVAHLDRRCALPNDYIAAHNALVTVYSDTKKADLAAARAFCEQNHGTND